MYHSISDGLENKRHSYYDSTTSIEAFAAQMEYLHNYGYQVIGLDGLTIHSGNQRGKLAVITFDDGLKNFYTQAFPILEKYRFTATVFLITDYVEKAFSFKKQECMGWREVKELAKQGITFGSHTSTHPLLRFMSESAIEYEIKKSKELIEKRTGKAVLYFSYPYAFPEEDGRLAEYLRDTLKAASYKGAVTTVVGRMTIGDDSFFLRRIPINSHDDLILFEAKLEGAYDWVHFFQLWNKRVRSLVVKLGICTGQNCNAEGNTH